jgi:hypothetical protein
MQSARQTYYAVMQQEFMQRMTMGAEARRRAVRSSAPPWNGVSFGAAAATAAAAAILGRAGNESVAAGDLSANSSNDSGAAVGSWSEDAGGGSW